MWSINEGIISLKKYGAKITPQRIAILKCLQGRLDHPSANDIYKELIKEYPSISFATVYGTAQLLTESGLLRTLSIDNKRVYFDPNTQPHAHFLCRSCASLIDIPFNETELRNSALSNMTLIQSIDQAEIFLYGTCSKCTQNKQMSSKDD
ncbi:MAG: Fur family transcriptional regulator [Synergistaceae bacterium]